MRRSVLMLIACVSLGMEQGRSTMPERQTITSFAVNDIPAIQALLELSRTQNVPLGIIQDDRRLCETKVSYSAKNVSVPTVIQGIVTQVPGYKWRSGTDSSIPVIGPVRPRTVTAQFLGLVDDHYGPIKGTPQTLLASLWVHVRYSLHPQQGTAMSVLGSPADRVFELEVRKETIQQILNRIAVLSRGTWVLRSLPDNLPKLGAEIPFSIFSNAGSSTPEQGDLCKPLPEARE